MLRKKPPGYLRPENHPLPPHQGENARRNPVTRAILAAKSVNAGGPVDPAFEQWAARWDELEGLVLRVYRGNAATAEDTAAFERLRVPVVSDHARWARRLEAHWRQVREAGEPCDVDPFLRLLIVRTAGEFVGNWEALQALPPAREAINRLLLDWRGE